MKIAVCDKNQYFVQHFLEKIQSIIEQYNNYNFEFEYFCYTNPEKMINEHKDKRFYIAFWTCQYTVSASHIKFNDAPALASITPE